MSTKFAFSAPPRFMPHALARGPHAQTLLPYFLGARNCYRAVQIDVPLPDGDTVVLHDDCPEGWTESNRIVVLVHGLGGSHASGYMIRMANTISGQGFRTMRMDMRGCGAGLLKARGVFHADRNKDLLAALQHLAAQFPTSRLTVCGFSLGANLILKMLGTEENEVPAQLDSSLVVEPPIDLGFCCHKLSHGPGWIYDKYFAKFLWRDFVQRRQHIDQTNQVSLQNAPTTLLAFDRAVTAPLAGYATADEYYRNASSKDVLQKIKVPTVILTAKDDPIIPFEIFRSAKMSSDVQLFAAEGGGHLGFYSRRNGHPRSRYWMDQQLLSWIIERDRAANKATELPENSVSQRDETRSLMS